MEVATITAFTRHLISYMDRIGLEGFNPQGQIGPNGPVLCCIILTILLFYSYSEKTVVI